MVKIICGKCGAEILVKKKEKDKYLYCLACRGFFFKIDSDGKLVKAELNLA